MKRCFVIMPYGGANPEKQRRFTGVYEGIIAPAARQQGFDVKRSDIASEPGNITHDIIRDLVESDIVIADLTTANANVFFELGIRHAFRKSGTVHIVEAGQHLPFDVQQYRAIEYSTELADVPDAISSIAAAIRKRVEQADRPDNPVHDAIPELPLDIRTAGDVAVLAQLRVSEASLQQARADNERLQTRLREIDPEALDGTSQSEIDIDGLMDRADEILQSTGQHAILRLRESMQNGGPDAFVRELRSVLKSQYLDPNDFAEIVNMCRESGLHEHRRATLKIAVQRHPHSHEMFLAFVDALDDSPNPKDQERARILIEERLGIDHLSGKPRLANALTAGLPLHEAIGVLFNTYFRSKKNEWVLSVIESLPEGLANDTLILRNRARALSELRRAEDAEKTYQQLILLDPNNDQTFSLYGHFLSSEGRYREAYEAYEKAIRADPEDPALYLTFAIEIMNQGFFRGPTGDVEGPIVRSLRLQKVVPCIIKAVEMSPSPSIREEAVRILVRSKALEEAHAIANGEFPSGVYDHDFLERVLNGQ